MVIPSCTLLSCITFLVGKSTMISRNIPMQGKIETSIRSTSSSSITDIKFEMINTTFAKCE